MKNYTEYNTKIGMNEFLATVELSDDKGFVKEMVKGEMVASIKLPNEGFTYDADGELIESDSSPKALRVDYLSSLRPVTFDFKIVEYQLLK